MAKVENEQKGTKMIQKWHKYLIYQFIFTFYYGVDQLWRNLSLSPRTIQPLETHSDIAK